MGKSVRTIPPCRSRTALIRERRARQGFPKVTRLRAKLNSSTVKFAFKTPALKAELELWCKQILHGFSELPPYRLLCYVDDGLPGLFPATLGTFHGLHVPIRGSGRWPSYVEELFLTDDYEFAFDNIIYIPGSVFIHDPITFVMILAHEFQHFVQYGQSTKFSEVNNILLNHVGKFDPDARRWDIPYERDAMIVSKRVATAQFGTKALEKMVQQQTASANAASDFSKKELWMFIGNLHVSNKYDWREETRQLVTKYRPQLRATLKPNDWEIVERL